MKLIKQIEDLINYKIRENISFMNELSNDLDSPREGTSKPANEKYTELYGENNAYNKILKFIEIKKEFELNETKRN